jgi:hypothetical protein
MKILKIFRVRNLGVSFVLYNIGDTFFVVLADTGMLTVLGFHKKRSRALRHFNRILKGNAEQNDAWQYSKDPVEIKMTYSEAMAEINSLERE